LTSWSVRRRRGDAGDDDGTTSFVLEESLGYLVNRVARDMAQLLAEELRPSAVGVGQWAVLLVLWSDDGLSQAALSRVVAIEPPTMVRTIDRMVRDGLVERRPDPRDARISRIHLTEHGRDLKDELIPKAVAVNERVRARLGSKDARRLVRLLSKVLATPS